ncbi:hypothetical protein K438DRAFT_1775263 [Mycena galopus ATCC 62051]|nr:hypothetical protein K438DRAFT_1775263 [Mycena galopus ATCC 62051]
MESPWLVHASRPPNSATNHNIDNRLLGTFCSKPAQSPTVGSLVLNRDANCEAFLSQKLAHKGIQSFKCFNDAGTVNGFGAGPFEDIQLDAVDAAAGVLVPE